MTKNDNFKEYGMPVVVLVAICFVTTLLLALTNSVSEPIIIKNAAITATAYREQKRAASRRGRLHTART